MKNTILHAVTEIITRLTIGLVFMESGWGKFQDIPRVISYFTSLELPLPAFQAYLVSGVELAAGLAILLGLFTRLASVPLLVIMLVAIRTAKWEDVTDLSSLLGISEFLYAVILLWLIALGSNFLSLDKYIPGLKK